MKRWTIVFRALANVNRLKVIRILSKSGKMNVTEITDELGISFKATSNHLVMLKNLDVLDMDGAEGHVFYSINPKIPNDFRKALKLFLD